MKYAGRLRKILDESIDRICFQRDKYFVSPKKDFTRRGKFVPQDIFKALLTMEGSALSHELLSYFDFMPQAPSESAFVQSRAKIKPEAFDDLFHEFVSLTQNDKLYKGYRLLAVDGSDIHVPTYPADRCSFHPSVNGAKPYNLLHLNALYDLMTHTYTDAVIQKRFHMDEHRAFISMAQKHSNDPVPAIFIADRGYESYNNMAHISEIGSKFLIRIRDSKIGGIISGLSMPAGEYDISLTIKFIRKQSAEAKAMIKNDRLLRIVPSHFDFLPSTSRKHDPIAVYELPIRFVRFKITKNTYEVIATNLSAEEFSPNDLKKLYAIVSAAAIWQKKADTTRRAAAIK